MGFFSRHKAEVPPREPPQPTLPMPPRPQPAPAAKAPPPGQASAAAPGWIGRLLRNASAATEPAPARPTAPPSTPAAVTINPHLGRPPLAAAARPPQPAGPNTTAMPAKPTTAATEPSVNAAAKATPAPEHRGSRRGLLLAQFHRLPPRLRIALAAPLFALAASALFVGAMLVYYTLTFPNPLAMRNKERAPVIRILARDGSMLAERGAAHDYMPLDLLPRHVIDAVVATEDRRFWDHWGLDPYGLGRAVFANLRAGRFAQGGSTLTQQLAKNLFLSSERTLGRKVEELLLALWLEVRLTKRDILELYLNQVYFGGGAYGIESASHRYFERSARELSLAEAALIAGLLKAPSKYSPASSPGAARARGRTVLKKMVEAGLITADDEHKASRQRIQFAAPKANKDQTGIEYAIDFVLERMPALVAADRADIIVETTIDPALQRKAQSVVQSHLTAQGEAMSAGQAALVVLDTDGGIRALVGGRSYAESQFNRAVKARRQPGSVFKPLVYLTALENGLTPETVAYDLPLTVEGWTPRNDSGQYIGAVSLRQALSQSINTVAVRLMLDVGARKVAETARRLGIRSDLRQDPTLALGSSELTLLELTGAYGVLGNGGASIDPHAIRRVRLSTGRVIFARSATRTVQAVEAAHVGGMNDMLNAALVSGTGKRAAIPSHPAAGKTGTTSDFRDAWFIGYTAHLTGGVWVGNDNGQTMNKVMGGTLPAQIWREVMLAAHEGRAVAALPGARLAVSTSAARGKNERELLPWARPRFSGSPKAQASLPAAAKRGQATPYVAQSASQTLAPAATIPAQQPAPPPATVPAGAPPAVPAGAAAPATPQSTSATGTTGGRARVPVARKPAPRSAADVVRAPAAKPRSTHPSAPIGEDFIARVTQDPSTAPDAGAQTATAAKEPASTFDIEDIRARIEGRRGPAPAGMMALGSGGGAR